MRLLLLLLNLALVWAPNPAGAGGLSLKEASAARGLYVAKCAKCHKFYEPRKYSESDWQRWFEAMSRKSKLKPAQKDLLRRYLDDYRAGIIPRAR